MRGGIQPGEITNALQSLLDDQEANDRSSSITEDESYSSKGSLLVLDDLLQNPYKYTRGDRVGKRFSRVKASEAPTMMS